MPDIDRLYLRLKDYIHYDYSKLYLKFIKYSIFLEPLKQFTMPCNGNDAFTEDFRVPCCGWLFHGYHCFAPLCVWDWWPFVDIFRVEMTGDWVIYIPRDPAVPSLEVFGV